MTLIRRNGLHSIIGDVSQLQVQIESNGIDVTDTNSEEASAMIGDDATNLDDAGTEVDESGDVNAIEGIDQQLAIGNCIFICQCHYLNFTHRCKHFLIFQ